MLRSVGFFYLLSSLFCSVAFAQNPPAIRPIPEPGIAVPAEILQQLQAKLTTLNEKIATLEKKEDTKSHELLPDVQIFSEAVSRAIEGNTFYSDKDFPHAVELLDLGIARAEELLKGTHSWTEKPGLVVKGYKSRLDDSIQPYGLVIGADWRPDAKKPVRCDIWFRGRSEKGLELQFLYDRLHNQGEYQLTDGIVLHPFGRYCNANRFAGEVDVFEALEGTQKFYKIDPDRISVRGFSMGGAACWGFTVHYPCKWFASNPGAGFSETLQFRGLDKKPELLPSKIEQQLWTLYDADILADNLYNVNVIAYSGEIDKQKLAADIMVAAAEKRGIKFPYIIGPETAHKLHPDSKKLIAEQMDEWAKAGRPKNRKSVHFSTFTLKYNRCDWITINGLGEHWQEAYVDGDIVDEPGAGQVLKLKTRNVTDFTIGNFGPISPLKNHGKVSVDGQSIVDVMMVGESYVGRFKKQANGWKAVSLDEKSTSPLAKRHNLQGPIDDAFMDSFLFVEPTGEFINPAVKTWVQSEQARAVKEWHRQMRGEVRIKKDTEVTPEDMENHHLILWGCPQSNKLIGKIAKSLPIEWSGKSLAAGDRKFDPSQQALILIHPNPLNPERYVVLNSGVTYREVDYLNNSMQTPKLPDWAIVDFSVPPSASAPGKIIAADFFDEAWKLKPAK